jgi:hypothetical protein
MSGGEGMEGVVELRWLMNGTTQAINR